MKGKNGEIEKRNEVEKKRKKRYTYLLIQRQNINFKQLKKYIEKKLGIFCQIFNEQAI